VFAKYFYGIWRDRYVLTSLVNKDLQMKYRRSKIGIAWSILTPLGLVLIIGSVYSIIFGVNPKVFIPMLFAGLNPWLFISGTADGATMAFIGAEGYLKQTTVNAQIFPLRTVLVNFVNLMYSIMAYYAIYLFLQPDLFSAIMLMCVPGLVLMFIFVWGIANIASVVNLKVRDYQPLQSLILQGLFYATPIIFQTSILKDKGFELVYRLNPFYYLLEIVRTPMQGREIPSLDIYLIAIAISLIVFSISIFVIMKNQKTLVFKL
jgi:ABC-type polysaccharide/polyol phosphate export permease